MSMQTPTFDYYAELSVAETASADEIKTAYRRAAQIHHPDKNPDNVEEATRRFQRIQQAYETLSNPSQRIVYDSVSHAAGSDVMNDAHIATARSDYSGAHMDFLEHMARALARAEALRRSEERKQKLREALQEFANRRAEEAARRRADDARKRDHELKEKQEREEKERKARLQEEKDAAERERLAAIQKESFKQEARWKAVNAKTKDQKTAHCLHSDRCEKTTQRKKVKCEACGTKRGMITFKCPYCESHLCQLCVAKSAEKRAQDEKPKPAPQGAKFGGQNINAKARTPSPTSTNQHQRETEEAKPSSPTVAGDDDGKPMTPKRKKKKANKVQAKTQNEQTPAQSQPIPKVKPPAPATVSSSAAPSDSNVNRPVNGKKGAPKVRACYNCASTSHYAKDCPETERRCFTCGNPGHIAKKCPMKKG